MCTLADARTPRSGLKTLARRVIAATRPSVSGDGESILVVLVPSAEEAVGEFRARLDPAATMPAHVTVLYPFVPPRPIRPALLDELTVLFSAMPAFDFTLREVRWFGDRVVYLAPEPDAPFIELTSAVMAAYPGYPPYRGAFVDIVPHVCVAQDAPQDEMMGAAQALTGRLPVQARASEVCLMRYEAALQRWSLIRAFPLRAG